VISAVRFFGSPTSSAQATREVHLQQPIDRPGAGTRSRSLRDIEPHLIPHHDARPRCRPLPHHDPGRRLFARHPYDYGETHTDRLSQSVTIPSSATAASLVFFLHITTEEQTTTKAFDKLTVQVRRSNGQVTVLDTFSNLQKGSGYSLKSYNLTPFRGQTVQIQLVAVEDNGSMTSFMADDFAVLIE
jgi:hypothetical protein